MKKNSTTTLIKVMLHNDREALVDMSKVRFAHRITVEETGQDITRLSFDGGVELDVLENVNEIYEMIT